MNFEPDGASPWEEPTLILKNFEKCPFIAALKRPLVVKLMKDLLKLPDGKMCTIIAFITSAKTLSNALEKSKLIAWHI